MKNFKQITFTLLALVLVLSSVSVVSAVGTWKNPTATPPGNNTEAPVNVGTDAQDKAGVLRVTGFRSFFDAIFDTKVQIGTTASMPTSLKLLVDGKVGAEAYCDRQGNNCVTSSGIPVSSNTNTSNTSSGGSCSASDRYDSGWVDFMNKPVQTLRHNLGTTDTVVYMEMKSDKDYGIAHSVPITLEAGQGHAAYRDFYTKWFNKTANTIDVTTANNIETMSDRYVRIVMWKIGC